MLSESPLAEPAAPAGMPSSGRLSAVGLFAGIGGFEVGFAQEGISVAGFCERDDAARAVLAARFPGVPCEPDVRKMKALPACQILTAGFPCQDLSPAGPLAGITGEKSGLVAHVFRLLSKPDQRPEWVIFENVPFMLSLRGGAGIAWLVRQLEILKMRWAYRVVDSRAFGLAQRRRRLYIVASRVHDPRRVLFRDNAAATAGDFSGTEPCGFYWTEGNTGLGWAVDAVPPLKGSSGLGIVSPPAVWLPNARSIVAPLICAAEELQGFQADWTRAAEEMPRGDRQRWKLVGNAVSPPVAAWLGRSIQNEEPLPQLNQIELGDDDRWPTAAWGEAGKRFAVDVSEWPVAIGGPGLDVTLAGRSTPLSLRATKGFYTRLMKSRLRVPEAFKRDLAHHVEQLEQAERFGQPTLRQHASAG